MALTPRQQAFVDEYLVDLNATQAAIRAGYSAATAEQQGSRLLRNAQVADAVQAGLQERAERTGASQDDVVRGLMAIAFFDIRKVAEWGVEPDPEDEKRQQAFFRLRDSKDLADEVALALQEVRVDSNGQLVVKSESRVKALELLGRHLGMFKKDVDVNVSVGITVGRLHELAASTDDEDGGAAGAPSWA